MAAGSLPGGREQDLTCSRAGGMEQPGESPLLRFSPFFWVNGKLCPVCIAGVCVLSAASTLLHPTVGIIESQNNLG